MTTWREIKDLTADLFHCDLCGEPATSIHFVPWVGIDTEEVLFACARHDPGGYWIKLEDWVAEDRADLVRHLDEKIDRSSTDPRIGGLLMLFDREEQLLRPVVSDG